MFVTVFSGMAIQVVLQFVLQVILAKTFGTAQEFDAYAAALTWPVAISALIATSIGPTLVSQLNRSLEVADRKQFAGAVLVLCAVVTSLLAAGLFACASPFLKWYLPEFSPELLETSVSLLRILVWLIPGNTFIGLFQSILHQDFEYSSPAIASALGPFFTVLCVAVFAPDYGIQAVALATLGGVLVNLLVQVPALVRRLSVLNFNHQRHRVVLLIMAALPIVGGMLAVRVDALIDPYVATQLEPGSLARLRYATQIVSIFLLLGSGTVSTIVFPKIAARSSGDRHEFVHEVSEAFRLMLAILLPSLVVLVCFGSALIKDLFERGEFTAADTSQVAVLINFLCGLLIGASLGEICAKTMYSLHDTRTPTLVGSFCVLVGVVIKLVIVPESGLVTLACLTSAIFLTSGLTQLFILVQRLGSGILTGALKSLPACFTASALAGLTGQAILWIDFPFASVAGLFAGAVVYVAALTRLDAPVRLALSEIMRRTV